MDEDHDPDFEELLEEDRLDGGWRQYFLTSNLHKLFKYLNNIKNASYFNCAD